MAFTENLAQFFDQDDFGVAAIIKSGATVIRTISVIFNDPRQEVAIFGADAEANVPFAQCETSDLTGVTNAHTMTIGGVSYRISGREDDGTGTTFVQLRK